MRLKESMKMMGLSNWMHWFAWFVKILVFFLIIIILQTILLKVKVLIVLFIPSFSYSLVVDISRKKVYFYVYVFNIMCINAIGDLEGCVCFQ